MPRDRRAPPGQDAPNSFNDITPDPSRIGGVAEAPFVRLPNPAVMFVARAQRLRSLAEGHAMGSYLSFLASVVDAQGVVAALPLPPPVPADQVALRSQHAMPPISEDQVRDPAFLSELGILLEALELAAAPAEAQEAAEAVRAMADDERLTLACDILAGAFPMDRVAESLFVAAALQVHMARLATQVDAKAVTPAAEAICPVCGSAPVASMVVGWTQASKARYCACSLCGTLWNHVRIKCTACGGTEAILYHTIEDGPQSVGVETCATCHSYIKHMQQHQDGMLDPVADDVGSYALDLLAAGEGFRRSSINPLFLTG